MKCELTGADFAQEKLVSGFSIRASLKVLIQKDYPAWDGGGYISGELLNKYRLKYIEKMLQDEQGQLDKFDKEVLEQIKNADLIADKLELNQPDINFGERMSDKLAEFGGSWSFLISFALFLTVWIIINGIWLQNSAFDPFPFILLNLMLSCLAAIQAPIIMMSQKRQEARDRHRAQMDFKVNLKAELEIGLLHEKIDHIIVHQQSRIMELLLIQSEMLEEMRKSTSNNDKHSAEL